MRIQYSRKRTIQLGLAATAIIISVLLLARSVTSDKTACSPEGGLCFRYPANWKVGDIAAASYKDSRPVGYSIYDQNNRTRIEYWAATSTNTKYSAGYCIAGPCKFTATSIQQMRNLPDTELVSGIVEDPSGTAKPMVFVISDYNLSKLGIALNKTALIPTDAFPSFKVNLGGKDTEQAIASSDNYTPYKNDEDAKKWLDSPDTKTAANIIQNSHFSNID